VRYLTRVPAQELVVGLPRVMRGGTLRATAQTLRCRQFAERLADAAASRGLRVWLSDENDSSIDAAAAMEASGVAPGRRQSLLDAVAAAVILDNAYASKSPANAPQHVPPAKGVAQPLLPPRRADARLDWCARARVRTPAAAQLRACVSADVACVRGGRLRDLRAPLTARPMPAPLPSRPPPPPPPPPPRGVSVALLRRERGGAAARREQWGELGLD
jgi:RNase H-fold protein (predicted Holliday junction resolvase)